MPPTIPSGLGCPTTGLGVSSSWLAKEGRWWQDILASQETGCLSGVVLSF